MTILFLWGLEQKETLKIIKNSRAVITATKILEGQPRLLCEASSCGFPQYFQILESVGEYFQRITHFLLNSTTMNNLKK